MIKSKFSIKVVKFYAIFDQRKHCMFKLVLTCNLDKNNEKFQISNFNCSSSRPAVSSKM